MSQADCEFLFDVAKVASGGLSCEVREMFRLGSLEGYRVDILAGGIRRTMDIRREDVETDRGAVEAKLRAAIERLLVRVTVHECIDASIDGE